MASEQVQVAVDATGDLRGSKASQKRHGRRDRQGPCGYATARDRMASAQQDVTTPHARARVSPLDVDER
jgi:hypothetical protein